MAPKKQPSVSVSPQQRNRRDLIGFQPGGHAIVSGRTGCGKTQYVVDMLLNRGVHKNREHQWDAVIVMCDDISIGQPLYKELVKKFTGAGGVAFVQGLPMGMGENENGEPFDKEQSFMDMVKENHNNKHKTICIIDDLMMTSKSGRAEQFVTKLFTSLRHLGVDVWELNQAHIAARNRRLNCAYLICFDIPADQRSLAAIASQIKPETQGRDVMAAYRTATESHNRHGCLVICLNEPEDIRYRNTSMDQCFDLSAVPVDADGNIRVGAKLY